MFRFLAVLALAGPAAASSPDAWAAHRAAVEAACRALVPTPAGSAVSVEVNPFGSEHFGVALVQVTEGDGAPERMVCIVEKSGGRAELTAPFAPEGE